MTSHLKGGMTSEDLDEWIIRLLNSEKLTENELKKLCFKAKEILKDDSSLVDVRLPVTVAGDIHGQIEDLAELLRLGGSPASTNYLFLGDYLDRGDHSVEVISLLLAMKVRYPDTMTLLRGNHETRSVTRVYGFYDEVMQKYGSANVWRLVMDVCDYLPLSALIGGEVLSMHGGLSPYVSCVDYIRNINKFDNSATKNPIHDFLWSDPTEAIKGWCSSPRGLGHLFGPAITNLFFYINGLTLMTRGHQFVKEGFSWCHSYNIVTVFSAANYMKKNVNNAGVLMLDEHADSTFYQFSGNRYEIALPSFQEDHKYATMVKKTKALTL